MPKEKDIAEKTLESCDDVFADIVNTLVFGGRNVVRPEELTDAVTTSQMKLDGALHEQERDTAKFWNGREIRLALIGLENMTVPERDFVLRVFGYDGAAYREQVNARISARRAGQKPRAVYPAITLVLYFGERRWTAPRTLRECLEVELPPELLEMVPDYRLHVVELAHLPPEQVEAFQSDFFLPVYYLNHPDSVPPGDRLIRHVDASMKLMTAITGDPKYITAGQELTSDGKEDNIRMSYMFERAEARGEARGRAAERQALQAELDRKDREIAELTRQLARFTGGKITEGNYPSSGENSRVY